MKKVDGNLNDIKTFGERAIDFDKQLEYTGKPLPEGIRIMNPFKENKQTLEIAKTFYHKFYNDYNSRFIILGINPSRLGAGLTGIPFTDPKKLKAECGIAYSGKITHEPSSTFIYEMIHAYGGVKQFYDSFYISSPCPLGFTSVDINGKEKNYNYYDSAKLISAAKPFIIESTGKLLELGIKRELCFCLGTGKNFAFLQQLNEEHHFFETIIPLEHPRFIMQYKSKLKAFYIDKYLQAFEAALRG